MTREAFTRDLQSLRESLLRMAALVESQIGDALRALRAFDRAGADQVQKNDQAVNELFRQIRERVFHVTATQQPVACDLRTLMGVQLVAMELERMGDYAVHIARRAWTLAGLPHGPLRPEFGLIGELAVQQVRDIVHALIEQDAERAREVAARDDELDRLHRRVFDALIDDAGSDSVAGDALTTVTLIHVAHNLERIGDRVVNVAEDIVFLESGSVVELD
jgi:phosphate transport system protein